MSEVRAKARTEWISKEYQIVATCSKAACSSLPLNLDAEATREARPGRPASRPLRDSLRGESRFQNANLKRAILAVAFFAFIAAPQAVRADDDDAPVTFRGNVSWYGTGFNGRKTASGELFDMNKHTAAHRKLPFGTRILVENPRNGKSVIVKVNDRGPYAKKRVLDLSRAAADKIGILLGGVAFVECTVLPKDGTGPSTTMRQPMISDSDVEETSFAALAQASDSPNTEPSEDE